MKIDSNGSLLWLNAVKSGFQHEWGYDLVEVKMIYNSYTRDRYDRGSKTYY